MGFERITEKDFWKCSEGAMYAPIQGTRKSTTLKTGETFITESDTATLSWIDFGCTKNMLLAAIITAVVVVVAVVVVTVLVVGTGGLALGPLMLIGAAAATFAGTVAAVDGVLKCGQKNATQREWNPREQSMISQGIPTITGDRFMTCKIGGMVQYAPNVKSWGDAIALGGLNYITKLAECALGGAAVGAVGYMIPALAGGQIAFAAPTWASVATNVGTGFTGVWGASRALFGIDALANDEAMGKIGDGWDALESFGNAAIPEIGMGQRILTGQPQPTDFLLFLYLLNFKPGRNSNPPPEEGNLNNADDAVNGDKDGNPQSRQQGEGNNNKQVQDGEGRPYEVEPIREPEPPVNNNSKPSYDELGTKEPCFLAGTLIITANGYKRIENIEVGEKVISYNLNTKENEERAVLQTFTNWTNKYYEIIIQGNSIYTTSKHLFWIENKQKWISAKELKVGYILKTANQNLVSIEAIVEKNNVELSTYNFEVEGLHNYFVGELNILVHNQNKPSLFESTQKANVEIYEVYNVQTGETVYVGQTQQGTQTRFEQHIAEGQKAGISSSKYEWGDPGKYDVRTVESGNWDPYEAHAWEQHYIERNGGKDNLVNSKNAISEKKYDLYADKHNPC